MTTLPLTAIQRSVKVVSCHQSPLPVTLLSALQVMETATTCTVRLEDYATPEEGAKLMFEDLKRKLQPRVSIATMERHKRHGDPEAAQHEIYLGLHAERFVGGGVYFERINAHLTANDAAVPLIVSGDHGAGKTRSVWELRRRRLHARWRFVLGCSSQRDSHAYAHLPLPCAGLCIAEGLSCVCSLLWGLNITEGLSCLCSLILYLVRVWSVLFPFSL